MPRNRKASTGLNICSEILGKRKPADVADLSRYRHLHSSGRRLISSWLARAWERRNCQPEDSFEPFIFAWISFNGWASCITELDRDRDWLDALVVNQLISDNFSRMVADSTSSLSIYARQFQQLWPVFKAQEIRRKGIYRWDEGDRPAVIRSYLTAGLTEYQPKCWERHQREGSLLPLDWPHTIEVLYRVRCNLFHGEKAPHSEMDRHVVSSAFKVLIYFIREAGYIRP